MNEDNFRIFGGDVPRRNRSVRRKLPTKWTLEATQVLESSLTEKPKSPEWLNMVMEKFNGYDPILVLTEKELCTTDLDEHQARFSFPPKQMVDSSWGFLSDEEKETLVKSQNDKKKKGISVLFVDLEKNPHDVELRKWTKNLVLTKGWKIVIDTKTLIVGRKYPLWSFRSEEENGKLCFALVPNDQELASKGDQMQDATKDPPHDSMGFDEASLTMKLDDPFLGDDFDDSKTLFKDSGSNVVDRVPDLDPFDDFDSNFNEDVVKDTGNAQKDHKEESACQRNINFPSSNLDSVKQGDSSGQGDSNKTPTESECEDFAIPCGNPPA